MSATDRFLRVRHATECGNIIRTGRARAWWNRWRREHGGKNHKTVYVDEIMGYRRSAAVAAGGVCPPLDVFIVTRIVVMNREHVRDRKRKKKMKTVHDATEFAGTVFFNYISI